jgi:hypothetical protein
MCPTSVSPFIAKQQAHFSRIQNPASSCLQIGHIHFPLLARRLFFFRFFVLVPRYNHNAINDKPIIIKIRNTLIPDPITNKNILNANMAKP